MGCGSSNGGKALKNKSSNLQKKGSEGKSPTSSNASLASSRSGSKQRAVADHSTPLQPMPVDTSLSRGTNGRRSRPGPLDDEGEKEQLIKNPPSASPSRKSFFATLVETVSRTHQDTAPSSSHKSSNEHDQNGGQHHPASDEEAGRSSSDEDDSRPHQSRQQTGSMFACISVVASCCCIALIVVLEVAPVSHKQCGDENSGELVDPTDIQLEASESVLDSWMHQVPGWIVSGLLLLSVLCFVGYAYWSVASSEALRQIPEPSLTGRYGAKLDKYSNANDFDDLLVSEALLHQLLLPWVVCLIAMLLRESSSCDNRRRLYLLLLVPVIRICVVDFSLAGRSDSWSNSITFAWHFLVSKLEVMGFVSASLALAIVVSMEHHSSLFRARLLLCSWPAFLKAPLLENIGVCFLQMMAIATSCAAQSYYCQDSYTEDAETETVDACGLFSGLGGFVHNFDALFPDFGAWKRRRISVLPGVLFCKVLLEAAPQLYLQGSAIMAQGRGLRHEPTLVLCLLMSALSGMITVARYAVQVVCPEAADFIRQCRYGPGQHDDDPPACVGILVKVLKVIVLVLLLLALVLRPFAAEDCESRLWSFPMSMTLADGCVAVHVAATTTAAPTTADPAFDHWGFTYSLDPG